MRYTKNNIGPYNLHIINTDKFKTVTIKINFKRIITKQDITIRRFLNNILLESSFNYPSKRDLAIICEDLYDLRLSATPIASGNYGVLSFTASFLNSKYTEDNIDERVVKFLSDIIFSPNVIDNQFKEKEFNIVKKQIKEDIESYQDNPTRYSTDRMFEELDKKSVMSFRTLGYIEDLEEITPTNLYDYYESVIKSDLVDIFVIGDTNNSQIKKLLLENFKINTIKKSGPTHFVTHSKYRKKPKVVKEKSQFMQSQLVIGCKLLNLTDFERKYVLIIYSFILGSGPDSKLFKTVREKNSLCYTIGSKLQSLLNTIVIKSGIDKKDFSKALKLIKKEMKNMEKGLFEERDIESAKFTYLSSCKQLLDSPSNIINLYVAHEYMDNDLLEEKMINIKKVTKEQIIELAKKVHMDTVYLLEGEGIDED